MSENLVSIIIPVYQAEKYLRNTVESVLAQTYFNWELILVNDGSTDLSGEICDNYSQKDARIKVIHQLNAGQASARNVGINIAKGKYISFLDNDDLFYPDAIRTLVNNIEETGADISACSYTSKDENGNVMWDEHTYDLHVWNNFEAMQEFLSRKTMDIYVWTKLYRKTFLDKTFIRFEVGKCDEDFLFNSMAFLYAGSTVMQDVPLYLYIVRKSSTSRTFPDLQFNKYLEGTLYRVNKIEKMVAEHYPFLLYLAKRQKILYLFILLSVIVKHDRVKSLKYYKEIILYLRFNKKQVIKERRCWGMSLIGTWLVTVMPSYFYFYYRRWKDGNYWKTLSHT